jgi:steroid delta-isomerase-like uncharacterized protein
MSDPKAIERRYYEAFNSRDLDRYAELFTEDCAVIASGGAQMRGVEAMRAFDKGWHDAFPDCVITLESQTAEGNVVFSENTFNGTHTATLRTPAAEIPATGRSVTGHYVAMLVVRDGRIASFRAYFDRLELLEELGVVPVPA